MIGTMQDLVLYYFMIGTGFTLALDVFIRCIKTSEPLTTVEVLATIFIWPVMVIVLIVNFIKGIKNV